MPLHFVFLDTEVLDQGRLSSGNPALEGLIDLIKEGEVSLLISDVVQREILRHLRAEADEALVRYGSAIHLLRRLAPNASAQLVQLDKAKLHDEVATKLSNFLQRAQATVLPTHDLKVGPILSDYFEPKPPFEHSSAKKSEFPDAITLAALREWRLSNPSERLAVVSGDKGFLAGAKLLGPCDAYPKLKEMVGAVHSSSRVSRFLRKECAGRHEELSDWVEHAFPDFDFSIDSPGKVLEIKVESVSVSDEPASFDVVRLEGERATVVSEITVQFSAEIEEEDAYGDPEYPPMTHQSSYTQERSFELAVEVSIASDLSSLSLEGIDLYPRTIRLQPSRDGSRFDGWS